MRILLVDDHALFLEGLHLTLRQFDSVESIEEAADCNEALEKLAGGEFDIVLLDFKLPDLSGLEALAAIREARPDIPVAILSGEDTPGIVRECIDAGAMGFATKSERSEILFLALQIILAGGVYLPARALEEPADTQSSRLGEQGVLDAFESLTPQPRKVLRLVIQGLPNKLIARTLDISEATVKVHVSKLFEAFGVRNRTELVYKIGKAGITLPD